MSDEKKAAFPNEYDSGMTIREYYAGLAMQGLESSGCARDMTHDHVASIAVSRADALIAALQEATDADD